MEIAELQTDLVELLVATRWRIDRARPNEISAIEAESVIVAESAVVMASATTAAG